MNYQATVHPDDGAFPIVIEAGDRTIHTEAKRASDVEAYAREATAIVLGVPEEEVEVEVIWPEPIAALKAEVEAARSAYDEAMEDLTAARERIMLLLTEANWKQQDIATVAGLSKQRMSQLAARTSGD